jgi:hypothetical protein
VGEGQLLMTQAERDRLVALKKAKKKLITQKPPSKGLTEDPGHVRAATKTHLRIHLQRFPGQAKTFRKLLKNMLGLPRFELGTSCTPNR